MVIEYVILGNFEDEEYLCSHLMINSHFGELQASFKGHNLSVVNIEENPEALGKHSMFSEEVSDVQKFGYSTNIMDTNLRRNNSLCHSREYDVKEDIIMIVASCNERYSK